VRNLWRAFKIKKFMFSREDPIDFQRRGQEYVGLIVRRNPLFPAIFLLPSVYTIEILFDSRSWPTAVEAKA